MHFQLTNICLELFFDRAYKSQIRYYRALLVRRHSSLNIKSIRLRAEVAETIPSFPVDLIEVSPASASTELALYQARLNDLSTKEAILEQQRIQKRNEIQELKIQFDTASNGLDLIRREIATIEPLVRSGLAPETRLITLHREDDIIEDGIGVGYGE